MRAVGNIYLILFLLFYFTEKAGAQCMQFPVSVEERIENSVIIAEGIVTEKKSFRNSPGSPIFTVNTIRVLKTFKEESSLTDSLLRFITPGGDIGDELELVTPSLETKIGDIGVYFLKPADPENQITSITSTIFDLVAGTQGFIRYDLNNNLFTDPFYKYTDIPGIYSKLEKNIGLTYKVYDPSDIKIRPEIRETELSDFSPQEATAGTYTILTLTGAGFGNTRGKGFVAFKNADDGGNSLTTAAAGEYISWKDNEVKVKIPNNAGTGIIQLLNSSNTVFKSSKALIIHYAEINVLKDTNKFRASLIDANGNGGFLYRFSSAYNANQPFKDAFIRAMKNWKCSSKISLDIGEVSTVDAEASDGINVVRFGTSKEFPLGQLAITRNYYKGCIGSTVWFEKEMDIKVNPNINWQAGPDKANSSQYDLESALLHEIGHSILLGHIISPENLMNFSVSKGLNIRELKSSVELIAEDSIMQRSYKGVCGMSGLKQVTPEDCGSLYSSVDNKKMDEDILVYPNPADGFIHISFPEPVRKITLLNVLGEDVSSHCYLNHAEPSIIEFDKNALKDNIYFIRLEFSQGVFVKKIQLIH